MNRLVELTLTFSKQQNIERALTYTRKFYLTRDHELRLTEFLGQAAAQPKNMVYIGFSIITAKCE